MRLGKVSPLRLGGERGGDKGEDRGGEEDGRRIVSSSRLTDLYLEKGEPP
jgi:hypothetical protein